MALTAEAQATLNETTTLGVFAITGTLPNMTRAEAIRRIKAAGGIVKQRVTRKVDFIVVGVYPGSRLTRAEQLRIRQLDEAGLIRKLL